MPNPTDIVGLVALSKEGKPGAIDTWGDDGVNCYAFAVNCQEPKSGKPNPGGAAPAAGWTAETLRQGAEKDGLKPLKWAENQQPNALDEGQYLVAGYVSDKKDDHHWYRRDSKSGYWVHKPGASGVKNYGAKFTDILGTDLSKFDHKSVAPGKTYVFVDYFLCPQAGLRI